MVKIWHITEDGYEDEEYRMIKRCSLLKGGHTGATDGTCGLGREVLMKELSDSVERCKRAIVDLYYLERYGPMAKRYED